ncbi:hypothetical protein GQ44DRAFT_780882 [Phaeosphaeriaceae sp. PMI808]|nr:hypothetical protein GQ44DRAFT_780882 [Phaeosphaeriaceae sp. PMI808]
MTLTEATYQIATAFRADRIGSYKLAANAITLDPAELAVGSIISNDEKFAYVPLPAKDKTVLLVWARYTGTKTDTGFNPEGDSDPVGQKQLLKVAYDLGFSVITVGDASPLGTIQVVNNEPCVLDELWKHALVDGKGRAAQATFFAALMERYPGKLY